MDAALVLLLVFLVYSVLLGVCLARMRSITRELEDLKNVMTALGTVQRDTRDLVQDTKLTPEVMQALTALMGAGNE